MRSKSTKTDEGATEWMIPEAAVTALKVIDRWALLYQSRLTDEIQARRAANPNDVEIAEAQKHVGAVFLGLDSRALGDKFALCEHPDVQRLCNWPASLLTNRSSLLRV